MPYGLFSLKNLCRMMKPMLLHCSSSLRTAEALSHTFDSSHTHHACAWRMAGRLVLPSCHTEFLFQISFIWLGFYNRSSPYIWRAVLSSHPAIWRMAGGACMTHTHTRCSHRPHTHTQTHPHIRNPWSCVSPMFWSVMCRLTTRFAQQLNCCQSCVHSYDVGSSSTSTSLGW